MWEYVGCYACYIVLVFLSNLRYTLVVRAWKRYELFINQTAVNLITTITIKFRMESWMKSIHFLVVILLYTSQILILPWTIFGSTLKKSIILWTNKSIAIKYTSIQTVTALLNSIKFPNWKPVVWLICRIVNMAYNSRTIKQIAFSFIQNLIQWREAPLDSNGLVRIIIMHTILKLCLHSKILPQKVLNNILHVTSDSISVSKR